MKGDKKGVSILAFLLYLIFGLYLVNYHLAFIEIPKSLSVAEGWIIFAGGVLLLIGAVNVLRIKRLKKPRMF